MPETSIDSVQSLTQAQHELVQRVIGSANPARVLALVAPVGSGKTRVATMVGQEVLGREVAGRVLYVVPQRLLAAQYQEALPGRHVEVFSRAALRDVQAASTMPFATPVSVFVSGRVLAAPDVRHVLGSVRWSVVVVDETPYMAEEAQCWMHDLVEAGDIERLLLLASTPIGADDLTRNWPDADVQRWTLRRLDWRFPTEDAPAPRVWVVRYERSESERKAQSLANQLLDELGPLVTPELELRLRLANQSSFYALEQETLVLRDSLRRRRNVLAHRNTAEELDTQVSQAEEFLALTRALSSLDELADRLDELPRDTKAEAFSGLLPRLSESSPICAFVALPETAGYLQSKLREADRDALAITGEGLPAAGAIEALTARHGVLLIDDDALHGIDLRAFTVGIHYDLPAGPRGWVNRLARLGGQQSPADVTTYVLLADKEFSTGARLDSEFFSSSVDKWPTLTSKPRGA